MPIRPATPTCFVKPPSPSIRTSTGPTLFPLGYGLTGASRSSVPVLSEDARVTETDSGGVFMDKGLPAEECTGPEPG